MTQLMDEKQAAALLNVSVKTLQARRSRGGGPRFVKLGRSVRYAMADLEAFVLAAVRTSTSDPGVLPRVSPASASNLSSRKRGGRWDGGRRRHPSRPANRANRLACLHWAYIDPWVARAAAGSGGSGREKTAGVESRAADPPSAEGRPGPGIPRGAHLAALNNCS